MSKKAFALLMVTVLLAIPLAGIVTAQDAVTIQWWSHWANEPAKKAVIEQIAADYMAENPNVNIEITWWDKQPLFDAVRNTMIAGQGAPDITTFDIEVTEWVEAGWVVDLEDYLPWDNFIEGTRADGNYQDLGIEGQYKFNISSVINMLFYNPDIFAELGIQVPEDYQFTTDEFLDVVQQCTEAGYAGVADAIGNRAYPGVWPVQYALWTLVGPDEWNLYNNGAKSWDTPEARRVLEYTAALRDAGLWPTTFSTMTIDEFHIYFHTQRQACMLYVPTWYSGRAFQPQANGGQDPDWHFGMLRYPAWEDGVAADTVWASFESGYAILSSSQHQDVAGDILAFAAQPRYGALWTAVTNSPSAIRYDVEADWPSGDLLESLGATAGLWDWYWAEFAAVYGDMPAAVGSTTRCGDFDTAVVSALNEGLPLGLLSVDDAIQMLDEALCTE